MLFKKESDLRLPKLPPPKREKGVLDIFRTSFKKVELPKTEEEPEILKKVDLGEKTKKIEPELYFWLCDGRIIKDLKELTQVMKDMKEEIFNFHVTEYKNEFSDWLRDIVKDEKLADKMSGAKTVEEAYTVLSGKKPKKKKAKKRKVKMPEPPKIEEVKEKKTEKEISVLKALEEEKEASEKIEEVIEKPEVWLPYEKIISKPKREKKVVKKAVRGKRFEELREVKKEVKVKKPRLKGVDKINKILEDANYLINQGDAASAKSLTAKARSLLRRASMPKHEKKKLNYKVVDIETRAKLFMLS